MKLETADRLHAGDRPPVMRTAAAESRASSPRPRTKMLVGCVDLDVEAGQPDGADRRGHGVRRWPQGATLRACTWGNRGGRRTVDDVDVGGTTAEVFPAARKVQPDSTAICPAIRGSAGQGAGHGEIAARRWR